MNDTIISMIEVQPQLTRLFQDRREITLVRLGRSHTPVVVLAPWTQYVAWRVALIAPPVKESVILEEAERDISGVSRLFLSFTRRVAPLLASESHTVRVVVVKVRGLEVGAVIAWQDWQRVTLPAERIEQTEEQSDRVFTVVTASRHLAKFAREQEQGLFRPVTVTRNGKPLLVIVPFADEEQQTQREVSPAEIRIESTEEEKMVALLLKRAQAVKRVLQTPSTSKLLNQEFTAVVSQALEAFLDMQQQRLEELGGGRKKGQKDG